MNETRALRLNQDRRHAMGKDPCKSSIPNSSSSTCNKCTFIPTSIIVVSLLRPYIMNSVVVRRNITEFVDASSLSFGDIGGLPQFDHKGGVRRGILILAFHDSTAFPY